ncbi:hypothetical protein [Pseudemcibacter aquimaris]|uniref:hypothetical protein n=1 Tax=Pseudemcibacter aquimaris TaxID=2857064 RepID=UPI002013A448|nr:hypothetical protein [Pseudemcibacter aquimaris]MCC3860874.1 hypothetical protein [Pseudemcibacter aquimaris]WDU59692.1 hypothetical protein KW060_05410 [Pseudemcibacter aquimaris]
MTSFSTFLTIISALTLQESVVPDPDVLPPQGMAQEQIERIILVTPAHCNLLTPHIPDADVEYNPGKDVRGRDVVPADLNGGGDSLGIGQNGYSFYLTHDALRDANLNEKYGLTGSQEGKIILGQVTVKDGDVLWNGASLREADRNRIYMLCDEERRTKKRPIIKR